MGKFKLLITSHSFGSCGEDVFDKLKKADIDYTLLHSKEILREEDLIEIIGDYDGIIVGADIINKNVLDHANNLKIISKHGVGLDNIDLEEAKKKGIKVAFAKGSNSAAVGELAISMMFDLARNLTLSTNEVKKGLWNRRKGKELGSSTIGIIGTGNIGREVIKRLSPFVKQILLFDSYKVLNLEEEYLNAKYVELEDLLKQSDFVTIHIPLFDETRNLINKDTLALMKKDAYLINCARGGIVNEEDLYFALTNGVIAGAGIDTFIDEPPVNNKLLELDNVVCSPHAGAYTGDAINKMSQLSADAVIAYVNKQEIKNLV